MNLHHTEEAAASDAMTAVFLKGHLKMMAVGMKNSRISGAQMLAKATQITGTTYKRGQYDRAVGDLQTLITHFQSAKA